MTIKTRTTPLDVLFAQEEPEKFVSKKKRAQWSERTCSVCGNHRRALGAGDVLGKNFGSWQELSQHEGESTLCEACIWGFKNTTFLRSPYVITKTGGEQVSWAKLCSILTGPVSEELSVIAPSGGRKIVAPYSTWGKVASDGVVLTWTPQYRKAVFAIIQLYKVGVRGQALLEQSVPAKTLDQVPAAKHDAVRSMWDHLSFIRGDKALSSLFVKLSMNAKVEG